MDEDYKGDDAIDWIGGHNIMKVHHVISIVSGSSPVQDLRGGAGVRAGSRRGDVSAHTYDHPVGEVAESGAGPTPQRVAAAVANLMSRNTGCRLVTYRVSKALWASRRRVIAMEG